eukprot:gnl/Chilomastix_cuspidata/401.p1 GENE.gnl/Chilomastix_cuspidata/401~~gnl/Chilomastix_cuspidata/401.p1  ORF type:complete len:1733 (-),score=450.29 gnl/Chilomastix_cuspidata/401:85-5283(-)
MPATFNFNDIFDYSSTLINRKEPDLNMKFVRLTPKMNTLFYSYEYQKGVFHMILITLCVLWGFTLNFLFRHLWQTMCFIETVLFFSVFSAISLFVALILILLVKPQFLQNPLSLSASSPRCFSAFVLRRVLACGAGAGTDGKAPRIGFFLPVALALAKGTTYLLIALIGVDVLFFQSCDTSLLLGALIPFYAAFALVSTKESVAVVFIANVLLFVLLDGHPAPLQPSGGFFAMRERLVTSFQGDADTTFAFLFVARLRVVFIPLFTLVELAILLHVRWNHQQRWLHNLLTVTDMMGTQRVLFNSMPPIFLNGWVNSITHGNDPMDASPCVSTENLLDTGKHLISPSVLTGSHVLCDGLERVKSIENFIDCTHGAETLNMGANKEFGGIFFIVMDISNLEMTEQQQILPAWFSLLDFLAMLFGIEKLKTCGSTYILSFFLTRDEKKYMYSRYKKSKQNSLTMVGQGEWLQNFVRTVHSTLSPAEVSLQRGLSKLVIFCLLANEFLLYLLAFPQFSAMHVRGLKVGGYVGDVSCCVIGRDKLTFDVFGTVVNSAARLAYASRWPAMLISSDIWTIVSAVIGKHVKAQNIGFKQYKGLAEPVHTIQVVSRRRFFSMGKRSGSISHTCLRPPEKEEEIFSTSFLKAKCKEKSSRRTKASERILHITNNQTVNRIISKELLEEPPTVPRFFWDIINTLVVPDFSRVVQTLRHFESIITATSIMLDIRSSVRIWESDSAAPADGLNSPRFSESNILTSQDRQSTQIPNRTTSSLQPSTNDVREAQTDNSVSTETHRGHRRKPSTSTTIVEASHSMQMFSKFMNSQYKRKFPTIGESSQTEGHPVPHDYGIANSIGSNRYAEEYSSISLTLPKSFSTGIQMGFTSHTNTVSTEFSGGDSLGLLDPSLPVATPKQMPASSSQSLTMSEPDLPAHFLASPTPRVTRLSQLYGFDSDSTSCISSGTDKEHVAPGWALNSYSSSIQHVESVVEVIDSVSLVSPETEPSEVSSLPPAISPMPSGSLHYVNSSRSSRSVLSKAQPFSSTKSSRVLVPRSESSSLPDTEPNSDISPFIPSRGARLFVRAIRLANRVQRVFGVDYDNERIMIQEFLRFFSTPIHLSDLCSALVPFLSVLLVVSFGLPVQELLKMFVAHVILIEVCVFGIVALRVRCIRLLRACSDSTVISFKGKSFIGQFALNKFFSWGFVFLVARHALVAVELVLHFALVAEVFEAVPVRDRDNNFVRTVGMFSERNYSATISLMSLFLILILKHSSVEGVGAYNVLLILLTLAIPMAFSFLSSAFGPALIIMCAIISLFSYTVLRERVVIVNDMGLTKNFLEETVSLFYHLFPRVVLDAWFRKRHEKFISLVFRTPRVRRTDRHVLARPPKIVASASSSLNSESAGGAANLNYSKPPHVSWSEAIDAFAAGDLNRVSFQIAMISAWFPAHGDELDPRQFFKGFEESRAAEETIKTLIATSAPDLAEVLSPLSANSLRTNGSLYMRMLVETFGCDLDHKQHFSPRVTVVHTDIVSFTNICSRISPGNIVSVLTPLFQEFDELCQKHGLEKIKTVGDAYQATGGLTKPLPDAPLRAARFAHDIIQAARRATLRQEMPLRLRVGIATGPVTGRIIGLVRPKYDIFGKTVERSEFLESCGQIETVHVDSVTADLLRSSQEFSVVPFSQTNEIERKFESTDLDSRSRATESHSDFSQTFTLAARAPFSSVPSVAIPLLPITQLEPGAARP